MTTGSNGRSGASGLARPFLLRRTKAAVLSELPPRIEQTIIVEMEPDTWPVTIYRLVMQDSIEERIVQLHRAKRELAAELLEGADAAGRLAEQQLLELIGG